MTIETLVASVGVLGALQTAYVVMKQAESRPLDGGSYWNEADGGFFAESPESRIARKSKKDFDIARAKAIISTACDFGKSKA